MPERAQTRAMPDETAVIQITAVTGRTLLRLRSWLPEYMNGGRLVVLAGQELPSQVGATLGGPMRALCLAPGEWLIASDEHPPSSLREQIESDLPKDALALVDLSDGLAGLEVRGRAVRDVLSKGCGLDLHPRSFPGGRCARTRFAQIALVIECLNEPPRFELYVARSYFRYLHSWLADAAREFGGAVT